MCDWPDGGSLRNPKGFDVRLAGRRELEHPPGAKVSPSRQRRFGMTSNTSYRIGLQKHTLFEDSRIREDRAERRLDLVGRKRPVGAPGPGIHGGGLIFRFFCSGRSEQPLSINQRRKRSRKDGLPVPKSPRS